jgi:hypothetical protein
MIGCISSSNPALVFLHQIHSSVPAYEHILDPSLFIFWPSIFFIGFAFSTAVVKFTGCLVYLSF